VGDDVAGPVRSRGNERTGGLPLPPEGCWLVRVLPAGWSGRGAVDTHKPDDVAIVGAHDMHNLRSSSLVDLLEPFLYMRQLKSQGLGGNTQAVVL
jgi:hypothetical protein